MFLNNLKLKIKKMSSKKNMSTVQEFKGNKLLFDCIDRQIILGFYAKYPKGCWHKKPLVVTRLERLKSLRDFENELYKMFKPILEYLARKLT